MTPEPPTGASRAVSLAVVVVLGLAWIAAGSVASGPFPCETCGDLSEPDDWAFVWAIFGAALLGGWWFVAPHRRWARLLMLGAVVTFVFWLPLFFDSF